MMKFIAARAARRTVLLRSPAASVTAVRAIGATTARAHGVPVWAKHDNAEPPHKFTSAHVDAKVPDTDYYRGHLLVDHLEYLDDVLEKTVELEGTMQELHETNHKKTIVYNSVSWSDSVERKQLQQLFLDSTSKKDDLQRQIDELKLIVTTARRAFAVVAPDGMPDDLQREEFQEISHIIDEAASEKMARQRAADAENRKVFGVDAPDGVPDDIQHDEMNEVTRIIESAALHEDGEAILQNRVAGLKVLGVDAPDGEPDSVTLEDMIEVNRIIEKAAGLKNVILQQRELDRQNRQVIAVDAPDGVPDSLNKEELLAIKHIIDEAAKYKNEGKIN